MRYTVKDNQPIVVGYYKEVDYVNFLIEVQSLDKTHVKTLWVDALNVLDTDEDTGEVQINFWHLEEREDFEVERYVRGYPTCREDALLSDGGPVTMDYSQIPGSASWMEQKLSEAQNLMELRDLLEEFEKQGESDLRILRVFWDEVDLTDLPTFGGEEPAVTFEIWSWDEESVLINDFNPTDWRIEPRSYLKELEEIRQEQLG